MISCHLTFIHIVQLITGADVWVWDIFDSINIDNDFKYKTTFYISRVMRGLSIRTTCLLSVFQAVTISPSSSFHQIIFSGAFTNVSETNQMKVTKSCSLFSMNYIIRALILTVTTSIDIFLVGVMLTTSAYMVIILFRHQMQHKHLHSLRHLRASPERKATQTIMFLVVSFVVMYWVDFIISSTAVLLRMYDSVILSVQKFVMNVYPTIAPLVQISSDNRIINMVKCI
ncbi:hypothetical protein U0070_025572, partial [Myodes glareolus]